MSQPVIDVQGLHKWFGERHVVRDVSLIVERGRITGFLGPNGAGKTTCMRLLCGLLTADAGEGSVLGHDFRAAQGLIKRQTGYMTQKFSLYDDLSIEENLLFTARIRELDHRSARVETALERLGLVQRRCQLAGTLSGGWKQRLALAVAVLHEPSLLLLDEPTAGVDPKARRDFWDTIHLLAAQGLTVLVSTHYMDEAERCHDIGYMLDGRLLARGTPEALVTTAGLAVLAGTGPGITEAAMRLSGTRGIVSATLFGAQLRVIGTDAGQLALATRAMPGVDWRQAEATLEDVFIHLVSSHDAEGEKRNPHRASPEGGRS